MVSDLSETSVFFDFDGTISTTDIGVHLLERLAGPGWRELDAAYAAGEIGSRECMAQQWACIPASVTESERRAVAREVPLDAAFGPLVSALRAAGAEVAVVSDGYGFYVRELLAHWDVPVFTNDVDFAANTVVFPYRNDDCASCAACGTCKPAFLDDARARGRATIFIGDGTSDRHAARAADVVFATGALRKWCATQAIAHAEFRSLADVQAAIFERK